MTAFPVTIYHNPKCGTSRNALALIRAAGYEPEGVEYVKTGWTHPQLEALFARMGVTPREMLRDKDGRVERDASDARILGAMVAEAVLVNRPIVTTPKGARLCRPPERALDLLERTA